MLIAKDNTNLSKYLVFRSRFKGEFLNNNKNTCQFDMVWYKLLEHTVLSLWDDVYNLEKANAGENFIIVNDTFPIIEKFRSGDVFILDVLGNKERMIIDSVDHATRKITFTSNLKYSYEIKTYHGKKWFEWEIDEISDEKVSKSSDKSYYTYSLIDYTKKLDRKVVIETFLGQYTREILGRILWEFVANDTETDIFWFETNLTGSWTANNTTDYTDEKINGNMCQKATTTGSWTWSWETAISSVNIFDYEDFRFWRKLKKGQLVDSFKIKLWNDSSNYREWNINKAWIDQDDCWNYENVKINEYDNIVWSPTDSVWFSIEVEATDLDYILFDIAKLTTGGITMQNCKRGIKKFEDVRFKGISPSVCIEKLTKQFNDYRYVDYNRDLHYYYADGENDSPFVIDETTKNYDTLNISVDTSQMINRQLVEWSESPSQSLYTQYRVADGEQLSFNLDFKASWERSFPDGTTKQWLKIFINEVEKSIGLEWLVNEADYDFVYSFNEKVVRNASYPLLNAGDSVKLTYYPYKTISIRYGDLSNIAKMKLLTWWDWIYEGQIIVDKSIESFEVARQRAKIEVDTKKNPIISYTFTTDMDGLKLWDMVSIVDIDRGIDSKFQIQKMTVKGRSDNTFEYMVSLTTKFFDYVEFFQLLLRKASNIIIDQSAEIIIPINVDEVLSISESYRQTLSIDHEAEEFMIKFDRFWDKSGSASENWYIGDPENWWIFEKTDTAVASAEILADDFTTGKSLRLQSDGDWFARCYTKKTTIWGDKTYTFNFWNRLVSFIWTWTLKYIVREYDQNFVLLETTENEIPKDATDFVNFSVEITTNIDTYFYSAELRVDDLEIDTYFGWYMIVEDWVFEETKAGFSFAS